MFLQESGLHTYKLSKNLKGHDRFVVTCFVETKRYVETFIIRIVI